MPPIPPRIVSMGGNNARIQGASIKRGLKREIKLPAKRLKILKLRANKVCTWIDLRIRL